MDVEAQRLIALFQDAGVGRGALVALAMAEGVGVGLASAGTTVAAASTDPGAIVADIEQELRPRWVMWSNATAADLAKRARHVDLCWDLTAVHRILAGGWRAGPGRIWASLTGLPPEESEDRAATARPMPPDLFSTAEDSDGGLAGPVRSDGRLDPEWVAGGWAAGSERLRQWAAVALRAAHLQQAALAALADRPTAPATARSESAAELLCAELAVDGLPMDRVTAETIIGGFVGDRPRSEEEAGAQRAARDALVLRHAPTGTNFVLRNPAQVRSLLRSVGIEVPDTRAWRLESMRDAHPLVADLLAWRTAERFATTFGYAWLDQHLGADGRLRGEWTGSDGAAGRMTASAGLHNMPADLRPAVIAEPGHTFVRADLGQIEPRVLAAVSGDAVLAAATRAADMYSPVAEQLGVDRPTAKTAVLGAMYGQTTGHGAVALRRLEATYPVAMDFLRAADVDGQVGRDLRTFGGRLVRMGSMSGTGISDRDARGRAAAQGRYGRNAVVQGAAAELFKVWAVTVRVRARPLDARIVLCLHDELLVHTPVEHCDAVAAVVAECLQDAAARWSASADVRFVADIAVVSRWSDAKG